MSVMRRQDGGEGGGRVRTEDGIEKGRWRVRGKDGAEGSVQR